LGLFSNPVYGATGPLPGLFYGGGFSQLWMQAVGVALVGTWCLGTGFLLFYLIKKTMGLRVGGEEEVRGLDVDEHGMSGYPDFVMSAPMGQKG